MPGYIVAPASIAKATAGVHRVEMQTERFEPVPESELATRGTLQLGASRYHPRDLRDSPDVSFAGEDVVDSPRTTPVTPELKFAAERLLESLRSIA